MEEKHCYRCKPVSEPGACVPAVALPTQGGCVKQEAIAQMACSASLTALCDVL